MIYREGLGRPLTWAELDSNFKSVDDIGQSAQAAASSARTDATIATTAQSAASASAVAADASAATAKAEADRASQIAGLDAVADAVGLCNAPFPDVWIPFSDSLRMIAGYGENIQVGGETVAVKASFSRASTATYIDKSGVLRTAAIDEPRFEREGLSIEGQSTNLLLNSGTLSTQSVTVVGGSYTLSFYGSGSVTLSGAATGVLGGVGVGRVSLTVTAVAGVLVLTVSGTCTNAQLEALPFASSYIPTAGAAATRAADRCTLQTVGNTNQEVTISVNIRSVGASGSQSRMVMIFGGSNDPSTARWRIYVNGGAVRGRWGNGSEGNLSNSVTDNTNHTVALRADGTSISIASDGSLMTSAHDCLNPPQRDFFYIGGNGSEMLFGHIRNFRIWHKALSDAQLKSLR